MLFYGLFLLAIIAALFFIVPKATLLHELIRLPHYNYKAQTAPRNNMHMEKHRFGKHHRQHLYFFLPKNKKVTQHKIIIYYHGGGWTLGNPLMFRCHAQLLVDQGYAVVMPSYRRLPFFRCPEMLEDAGLALKKTTELIRTKNLGDPPIVLSGLSAGGHIAALLAFDRKRWEELDIPYKRLAGLLLFAAPLDLSRMSQTPVIWRLAGKRNSPLFQKSNPIAYLKKENCIPVLIIHGTKDGLVNYKSSLSFKEKYPPDLLTFHIIKNGTHLDSGFWFFEEGEVRKVIFDWLE